MFCDRKRNGLESPQPRRSTVGHLPLEQVIGVRIPARLPTFRKKSHEELVSRLAGSVFLWLHVLNSAVRLKGRSG
jgi:hypothetical protein